MTPPAAGSLRRNSARTMEQQRRDGHWWVRARQHRTQVTLSLLKVLSSVILSFALCACPRQLPELELHQDYGIVQNGPHPAKFDSGQPATLTYTPADTALPTIADGRSIITYHGPGVAAGYATAQLNATAVYIEADWNFGSTGKTDGGQLALCLFATALPSGYLSNTPTPDSPAHVVFLNDHFEYGVWQNHILTIIAKVPYGRSYATGNQHVAVYVRKDVGEAWVLGPTGAVYGPFSDPRISDVSAPYVTAEQFYGNADTDSRVEIQRWRATSDPAFEPSWVRSANADSSSVPQAESANLLADKR
jgi:hypothetical protein